MNSTALGAVILLAASWCHAQPYPSKPVRVIVPYAAGGFSDLSSRLVTERMSNVLGQPMVVESRPGGGGRIGAEVIARAPAGGYHLLYTTNGTHTYMQITEAG